ncbi:amidohydrolase family protein [Paraburkholderia tropica]|uniref:amidohydrolase family protein n=1 Tax=Paraburkholderia tropica TaxID=92647 RepID=UPI0032B48ADF
MHAATALGGALMGLPDELGRIAPGYLADLLIVNGDPTEDVAILQNKQRLTGIMKDGHFHKTPHAITSSIWPKPNSAVSICTARSPGSLDWSPATGAPTSRASSSSALPSSSKASRRIRWCEDVESAQQFLGGTSGSSGWMPATTLASSQHSRFRRQPLTLRRDRTVSLARLRRQPALTR